MIDLSSNFVIVLVKKVLTYNLITYIAEIMQSRTWSLQYCGGARVFGEQSIHCHLDALGYPRCRCILPHRRNYELVYTLLVAVNQEKLHLAIRYVKLMYYNIMILSY